MLGVLVFTVFPVIFSLIISFHKWDLLTAPEFVGLKNYISLFTDDLIFRRVLENTLVFLIVLVPSQTAISLLLALALNQNLRGMSIYRTIYYLPVVTTIVAAALIFQIMLDFDYGAISGVIWQIGDWLQLPLQPPDWLNTTLWAKPAVIMLTLWKNVGFTTVLFLSGLQGIPAALYEAASIDGANAIQRFRYVTLPMLSSTTFFIIIILVIGAFQLFGEAFILTGGGPAYATMTVTQYIYENAFKFFRMGKAAAISWVLFVAIFAFTLLQVRLQRRWVYYEMEQ